MSLWLLLLLSLLPLLSLPAAGPPWCWGGPDASAGVARDRVRGVETEVRGVGPMLLLVGDVVRLSSELNRVTGFDDDDEPKRAGFIPSPGLPANSNSGIENISWTGGASVGGAKLADGVAAASEGGR